ncbi:MAG: S-methyl-5-thioribose-1-phosphate isomerase, partial [Planctomycetota bacterium]
MNYPALKWVGGIDGRLQILDQTLLPSVCTYVNCLTSEEVRKAITEMKIRGALAIGIAGAFGLILGLKRIQEKTFANFLKELDALAEIMNSSRPTAINLKWATRRVTSKAKGLGGRDLHNVRELLLKEVVTMQEEDAQVCEQIGIHGADLLAPNSQILTLCNTGSLASSGIGTALGAVYKATSEGKNIHVYVCETRPMLQGARLTCWELSQAKIPCTLIPDNAAGYLLKQGKIQAVLVGADRIASNGDVANKIGTYSLAVLAKAHQIPFYVCAPLSSIDLNMENGFQIPIEERSETELLEKFFAQRIAPEGIRCYNPAFDITPADFITQIVTEKRSIEPTRKNISDLFVGQVRPLMESTS